MIELSSAKIPEEFSHWCWVYFTSEAKSEMSDTENWTNCLQSWQKKLGTSQQVTRHMKINQNEQKSHFFQIQVQSKLLGLACWEITKLVILKKQHMPLFFRIGSFFWQSSDNA